MNETGPVWTIEELMKIGQCTQEYLEAVLNRVFDKTNGTAYGRIAMDLDQPGLDDMIYFDDDYISRFKEEYRDHGGEIWS
jgi:hypothetical protein